MMRKLMWSAGVVAMLGLSTAAVAQKAEFGTAAEAKTMLEQVVVAVKADKAKAFDMFAKGEGGFKDRDLYPFCGNASDGVITSHPSAALRGQKMGELKDKTGALFGAEMLKQAAEGKFVEVPYKWTRLGSETPVDKVSYVTKVGDQVCGVGYYK